MSYINKYNVEPVVPMYDQRFNWKNPSLINSPQKTNLVYKSYYYPYYKNPDEFNGPKPYYEVIQSTLHPTSYFPVSKTEGFGIVSGNEYITIFIVLVIIFFFFTK
jgi:hypothetical protein